MRRAVLVSLCLVAAAPLGAGESLVMRVSPAVAMAPALVTVQAIITADADNRTLEITAESPTFFRSSEIQLDGANAPRVRIFTFSNLPTGLYQVTGTLRGTRGERARVLRLVQVASSASAR